ncbi:helix-turn-helix domain-containing protein [Clostridioides difficile]|nr:helix-turn-helix domain-containing protein [Clostridioides difficile]
MNELDLIVNSTLSHISYSLQKTRESNNITLSDLSSKTGINRSTISLFEKGESSISLYNFLKICNVLNIDIPNLFSTDNKTLQEDVFMNKDSKIKIYYDSLTEAMWFQSLHPEKLSNAEFILIKNRGKNEPHIDKLLTYDKPDIILTINDNPVLILEISSECPTGHNVGQRFARLAKAIENQVLTIYFVPFDSRKHGTYSSICNLNIRLLKACENISSLFDTPLLVVNWKSDSNGELIKDGSQDERMKEIVSDLFKNNFSKNSPEVIRQLSLMKSEYASRLQRRPSYSSLPNSVLKYTTEEFINEFNIDSKSIPSEFLNRKYTFVYTMNMKPDKCKRQDPYTGTALLYDYLVCRNGIAQNDKLNNLVLNFPLIKKDTWFSKNPNDPSTKSCNWYIAANLLLFEDDFYINEF